MARNLFLSFCLLFLLLPVCAYAVDVEKDLSLQLRENRKLVLAAEEKLGAGLSPASEIARLKASSDNVRAIFLLLQERYKLRQEKAASVSAKASERHERVADGVLKALEEYLGLVENIPPDTVSPSALKTLKSLIDSIIRSRRAPLLGTLPYKHLGYPTREPATSPIITPAYRGGNRTITPADTAASTEAPISKEITTFAESLQWNPVLIYEWVKNNVETEWYWGVMKGAEETLRQKSGNDADQAALLVALLRASGFPARYVTGTVEFFPGIERAKNLTGIDDPIKIAAFFQKAGIPFKPVIGGGGIANFQIEHIWVESEIPYSNYRGAIIDDMGKTWLALDTSIKPPGLAWKTPLDIPGFPFEPLSDEYLQSGRTETPLEFVKTKAEEYLSRNSLGKSWQDLLSTKAIIPDILNILPASLQFRQTAITGEYTEFPVELKHRVKFTATSSAGSELFTITIDAMQLSNQRVALSYEPETVEDQQTIDGYGGLDNTPSYLVHLRPVLKLNDERLVVAQDGLPMGADYSLTIEVITPNGTERISNNHVVGNPAMIGVVAQKAIKPADIPFEEKDAERLLWEEALTYIDRWNQAEDELAALFKVAIARPIPTIVTVGGLIDVTYLLDIPHGFEWKGVFIDAALRGVETVTRTGDTSREKSFLRLSALQGSILENRIFEDDFKAESVSTAKLLQLAAANGTPLITIDKSNIDAALATLPFDDAVKADIVNAVNQNLTVKIPQTEMSYRDWIGIGYLKENAETGESGWMLSGMVAGGMTAVNKDQWQNQEPVYKLTRAYSPPTNQDPDTVTGLKRMTDYLKGIAGEELAGALMVMALDDKNHPVRNVPVTFRVVAGGGLIKGVNANGASLTTSGSEVTVKTEYDGIARVKLTLGEHTSDSPYYAFAVPSLILVGQNLVAASTPKGSALITLDKTMEALGYPGETVALVKVAPSQTDNIEGHVNTYSAPVWIKAVDKRDNTVSNKIVKFTAGTPQSLWSPPLSVDRNVIFFGNSNACPGVATRDCPNVAEQIQKYSDSSGAYAGVILGNTDNTRYPVIATAKKDLLETDMQRQETNEEISVTFNHSSYPVQGRDSGNSRAYLAAVGLQHIDENGNRIDAGVVGIPMSAPLEALLFSHEEVDVSKGAFISKKVTSGRIDFSVYAGGGSVFPASATAPTNGVFATTFAPGPVAGLNRIAAQATAIVQLQSGETKTLTDTTFFRIWGVKPDVVPNTEVYVNSYGYPEADVNIPSTISPAEYKPYSQYLLLYEDNAYMGFLPTANGFTLLSQGGAKFDIRKKYTVQLVLNWGTKQEIKSAAVPLNVTMLCLIPDYDHNRRIDYADRQRALKKDVYYFWVNDDDDSGDVSVEGMPGSGILSDILAGIAGTDIPGSGTRVTDHAKVGGTRDLVDWFPVHLDLGSLLSTFATGNYTYKLKQADGFLDFVATDLKAENAGDYLTGSNGGIEPALSLGGASTVSIMPQGHVLSDNMLQDIKNGKTVIMVEAWKTTKKPLVLEISNEDGKMVFTSSLNLSIGGVEQMFRHKNLVEEGGGPPPISLLNYGALDRLGQPINFPDSQANDSHFVFVHGYNVNGEQARGWNAEMFKRMYWSGSRAKFWGVTWYGWDTQDFSIVTLPTTRNFHLNVQNALKTAQAFSHFINLAVGGKDVTVAAHSLGNMLVSSAIAEKGANVTNYFLIDAAVPIEAYDSTVGVPVDLEQPDNNGNGMIHPEWGGYKAGLFASEWYRLFDSGDWRSKLTWRGRFAALKGLTKAYNFFSSGEDVLDNHTGTPYVPNIFTSGSGRFAWGLQEKLKGRLPTGWMLGSNYGGWGFNHDAYNEWILDAAGHTVYVVLQPDNANKLTTDAIKAKPFFLLSGDDLTLLQDYPAGSDYAKANYDRLLSEAIPAISLAAGRNEVTSFSIDNNFDMNLSYKNVWPYDRVVVKKSEDWWHCDLKEVSFPFVKELFIKFTELGK